MSSTINLSVLILFALFGSTAGLPGRAQAQAAPFDIGFEEVAPGIWAGVRPDGPRFPVMGTSTIVVSDDGVVVFDGGGMPRMADQVIAKIRSLTDAPVTHVVISHWHGDHNFGIHRYTEVYPNVQIVAHTFTYAVMNGSRIRYIDNYPDFIATRVPRYRLALESGVTDDGLPLSHGDRIEFERIIEKADVIDAEFKLARVTLPNIVFDDALTIYSGTRRVDLMYLGHGNTEGDIVMWLPKEKVVATGDIVVLPTPYAFNVPPRPWAATLKKLLDLEYEVLIPGHGDLQRNSTYVDLLIEAAESIAGQTDDLVSQGLSLDEVREQLDFSAFEPRFTGGDEYLKGYYDDYFEQPFRDAAIKALSGERMVPIEKTD